MCLILLIIIGIGAPGYMSNSFMLFVLPERNKNLSLACLPRCFRERKRESRACFRIRSKRSFRGPNGISPLCKLSSPVSLGSILSDSTQTYARYHFLKSDTLSPSLLAAVPPPTNLKNNGTERTSSTSNRNSILRPGRKAIRRSTHDLKEGIDGSKIRV